MLPVLAIVLAAAFSPDPATSTVRSQISDRRSQIADPRSQIPDAVTDSVSAAPTVDGTEGFLMPAVTIVERRGFDPLTGAGSSIDVPQTRGKMQTPAELLGQEAGVTIRRSGGLYQGVSIRGGAANQAQLFLNGTPLPSSIGGGVSASLFPLDALSRMDVYRGSLPVRFLRSPLSGGVNVVTLDPSEAPSGFRLGAGSFDAYEASVFAAEGNGESGILAGMSGRTHGGNFTYHNNNGTPTNFSDDAVTARRNNDATSGDFFVVGSHQGDSRRLDAHILSTGSNQGLAGFAYAQTEKVRLDKRTSLAGATWTQEHDSGAFAASLFGGHLRERLRDPQGELTSAGTNILNTTDQAGIRLTESLRLGKWRPVIAVEYEVLRFELGGEAGDAAPYNRQRTALGAGVTWELNPVTLLASGQAEYDRLTADDVVIYGRSTGPKNDERLLPAARLGLAYAFHPSMIILGNAGTGYRTPSVQEQFGNRGIQIGNPDLQPETAVYGDVGVQWIRETRTAAWTVDIRYFRQSISDIIGVYQTTPQAASAVNFESALAAGYEVTGSLRWRSIELSANASYAAIVNTGPVAAYKGNQLPGRPLWESGTSIAYRNRYVQPFYELDVQGPYFLDPVNTATRRIDRRFYHTAGLNLIPHSQWRLTGTMNNIGDEQSYDFIGYPLPGRSFTAVIQFTTFQH